MSIPTTGLITIASLSPSGSTVQLDTDPEVYQRAWPRRQSVRKGAMGAGKKQDFGLWAKDMTVHLDSGKSQWLNVGTVRTLNEFKARRGATFTFADGEGNSFTVTIESFDPDQAKGMKDLYTYTMDLQVWAITTLLGQSYTGN